MANQSLPDLTARTATADTDLIHVNSGGSDYKQTKANFLADYVSEIEFNSTSALTTQVDALPVGSYGGAYTGKIASYGHQSETGVPESDNYTVEVSAFSTQNKRITIMSVLSDKTYTRTKLNGTWGSWILVPRREEVTSLNNSLTNWNYYQVGSNSYGALECRYNPSLKLCFMTWRGNSTAPGSAQYSFNLPSSPVLTPNDNAVVKLRNGDSMEVRTDNTVKVTLTGTSWSGGSLMYPTR